VKEEGPPVALEFGGLHVEIYVDDQRLHASYDKALPFPQQLTDEEGKNYLVLTALDHLLMIKYQADQLQLNYWTFMHEYPAHHPLPPSAVTSAREALDFYVTGKFSQLPREIID
jgi:hypothetical protein